MYVERKIVLKLISWAKEISRRPLLLRGARQVGKSTLVMNWGKGFFKNVVLVNFEQYPHFKEAFLTYNPQQIINVLSVLTNQPIIAGETLLFLDEIQECPEAITSLRYFFEQMPALHVIGAGSSLEMVLQSDKIKIPVGRIEYLHLYPFSFEEFLKAKGEDQLLNFFSKTTFDHPPPAPIHEKSLGLLSEYFSIGGMPAVVSEYVTGQNVLRCRELQNVILQTYRQDWGKYYRQAKRECLDAILQALPAEMGHKLVYSRVSADWPSVEIKKALLLLEAVGVVSRIFSTQAFKIPLSSGIKQNIYKLLFLDVGLLHSLFGIQPVIINRENLMDVFRGLLAEQFVGQELIAKYQTEAPRLFYWVREAKSSSAEIDYLWSANENVYPIEVKAGKTGTLKSLFVYLNEKKILYGLRLSERPLAKEPRLLSIPLYLTGQLERLCAL